jgi:hypothetical protein
MRDAGFPVSAIPIEIIALTNLLGKETDRGCALVAGSYLDAELKKLLKANLVEDKPTFEKLFAQDRPLGSFSARIDCSYLIGLIPRTARQDLHLIRKIRNNFAHELWNLSFDSPSIRSRCAQLRYHPAQIKGLTARRRFMGVIPALAGGIHVALLRSNKPQISPEVSFAEGPEFYKKIATSLPVELHKINSVVKIKRRGPRKQSYIELILRLMAIVTES